MSYDEKVVTSGLVNRKSWKEFRDSQLLWWINRSLQIFGWSIAVEVDADGNYEAYPVRTKFRGFSEEREAEGFALLTEHISRNAECLMKDIGETNGNPNR